MVDSVIFSPNGKIIASGGNDNTIRLWDTQSGKQIQTFIGQTSEVPLASQTAEVVKVPREKISHWARTDNWRGEAE